jgi:hypothetical protein
VSIAAVRNADKVLLKVRDLEARIRSDEENLRRQIAAAIGGRCPRTIHMKLKSWTEQAAIIYEKKTKTDLSINW